MGVRGSLIALLLSVQAADVISRGKQQREKAKKSCDFSDLTFYKHGTLRPGRTHTSAAPDLATRIAV